MPASIYIVSHFFYPFGGVGALRSGYLADYFADQGWRVTVFKADDSFYQNKVTTPRDLTALRVVTVRPPTTETPDDKTWRAAYERALTTALATDERPTAILFSAGPYFYLPLVPILERDHDVRCVIDFRDTWLNIVGLYERGRSWTLKKRLYYLQLLVSDPLRRAIKTASAVLTVTSGEANTLRTHYGRGIEDRLHVVRNGYDERVLEQLAPPAPLPTDRLRVGIFGKFAYYDEPSAAALLAALETLAQERPVELLLIGAAESAFTSHPASPQLTVRATEFVDYRAGLEMLQSCHVCALNNRSANALGTKLFDYVGLNKPVLAFVHRDSSIGDFLEPFERAFVVNTAADCLAALRAIMTAGDYSLGSAALRSASSRRQQAQLLQGIIERISSPNP